jgi:O-succinylbenzoic acid--CoA ligase
MMALARNLHCPGLNSWPPSGPRLLLNPRLMPDLALSILGSDLPDQSDCVWLASSGSRAASKIKLVCLSNSALESSARAVNTVLGASSRDIWLNPLPPFHVGGFSVTVRAALAGCRCHMFAVWDAEHFIEEAVRLSASLASLVPTQLHDLVRTGQRCPKSLRAVVVGGAKLDQGLHARALELGWPILRSYGMTETSSQVATERSFGASRSDWLPLLDHFEARIDKQGVLELRGPSLLTGWIIYGNDGLARWEDPKRDGWFRTSDRAEMRGRELRVLGRVDDLVKIRGELVDVGALENALQACVPDGRVAVHCVPDERDGAALRVVAENASALKRARSLREEIFPPYARPNEFVEGPVEVTVLGKTVHRQCQ